MILIDTDVAVDLLRGLAAAHSWLDSLDASTPLALAGYSLLELIAGARNLDQLRVVQRWAKQFTILWLTRAGCESALEVFAQRKLSHNMSAYDAMIGQTAVENGITLYTFNARHFHLIQGIELAQPYIRG